MQDGNSTLYLLNNEPVGLIISSRKAAGTTYPATFLDDSTLVKILLRGVLIKCCRSHSGSNSSDSMEATKPLWPIDVIDAIL
jgi:hypothetical protein